MNNDYVRRAKEVVPDPKTLSVMVAKRGKQLAMGARPMVKCPEEDHLDIVLLEIAEGKLAIDLSEETEDKLVL
jgi:DNA-directed RNA polymerase subunit K/omega